MGGSAEERPRSGLIDVDQIDRFGSGKRREKEKHTRGCQKTPAVREDETKKSRLAFSLREGKRSDDIPRNLGEGQPSYGERKKKEEVLVSEAQNKWESLRNLLRAGT